MSVRSIYLAAPAIADDKIRISGEEHRHLMVARAEAGEAVEVFDGKGQVWTATVESIGKRETLAKISESRKVERDAVEIILGLALIRIAAFELAIEKAVEIGISRIVPFPASRSNAVPGNRHERWLRILIEAAKQSKHYYLPALDPPRSFDETISLPASSKIIFAENGGGPLKPALSGSPVLYLVGPEGGWTDAELASAHGSGFSAVTLGAQILKAETAAIVGGALIRYETGKLATKGT